VGEETAVKQGLAPDICKCDLSNIILDNAEKSLMRKVSISEGRRYLVAWGNENILINHVCYFEKRAIKEIEDTRADAGRSLSEYPNFAVWLRLYSELICSSLYWRLFRHQGDKEIFKPRRRLGFQTILEEVIKIIEKNIMSAAGPISEEELFQMKKSIYFILNLRHSFQHGGLPNLLRELSDDCEEMEFFNMLIPSNMPETKMIFNRAETLIKLLPQPTVICSSEDPSIAAQLIGL